MSIFQVGDIVKYKVGSQEKRGVVEQTNMVGSKRFDDTLDNHNAIEYVIVDWAGSARALEKTTELELA